MGKDAMSEDAMPARNAGAAAAEAEALDDAELEAVQGGTGDGPPAGDVPDNSRDGNMWSAD